jgi:hypothetical protein
LIPAPFDRKSAPPFLKKARAEAWALKQMPPGIPVSNWLENVPKAPTLDDAGGIVHEAETSDILPPAGAVT